MAPPQEIVTRSICGLLGILLGWYGHTLRMKMLVHKAYKDFNDKVNSHVKDEK